MTDSMPAPPRQNRALIVLIAIAAALVGWEIAITEFLPPGWRVRIALNPAARVLPNFAVPGIAVFWDLLRYAGLICAFAFALKSPTAKAKAKEQQAAPRHLLLPRLLWGALAIEIAIVGALVFGIIYARTSPATERVTETPAIERVIETPADPPEPQTLG